MDSNKRRKLETPSALPPLSAVAAIRALKAKSHEGFFQNGISKSKSISSASGSVTPVTQNDVPKTELTNEKEEIGWEDHEMELGATEAIGLDDDGLISPLDSRVEPPDVPDARLSMILSTFKPGKETVKEHADGAVSLRLVPGERLVILGQYEISVQKGQITLMGSILQASKTSYRVYASSSHALPIIRCLVTDVDDAEIRVHQCGSGLGCLKLLSPLFGKLWNDNSAPLETEYSSLLRKKKKRSTFQILLSSKDGPQKVYLQPLISPPEWNEMLAKISGSTGQKPPTIIVCGPKSSGKSTFTKLLANRLLSTGTGGSKSFDLKSKTGVAVLDLDPGQPEYSSPGQLSLLHIQEPNFGPPYTHPTHSPKCFLIRSHAIGAITPSLDPSLYMACALDLFGHYRNLLSTMPNCPLLINTPGWVLGTGLEILVDLIVKIRPSEIIYMSQDGPAEVVESLREARKSTPFSTLPSQGSEYTTRTAAHLRTMQSMSYFHLDPSSKKALAWKCIPLTSIPPWQVTYSGESAGIIGIMCYGEQPPANLLADTINGSLVAVVVINNVSAIPGWKQEGQNEDDESINQQFEDIEIRAFDEDHLEPQHLKKPVIVRTLAENLPYFNPSNTVSLNPKYSHTIGLALVRGIDVENQKLQILTPITPNVIDEVNEAGKQIVLVSGKLDTPGWAYTEELEAARRKGTDVDEDDEEENEKPSGRSLGDGFQDAPWIEKLEGFQGRGIGARVWRVRRDLGKIGNGGD